jgi:ubiquitin-conjugating enzyme E2 H
MWKTRVTRDISQLQKAGFVVKGDKGGDLDDLKTFQVQMITPKDSAYEGYEYTLLFTIPETFPFKSPSVGFRQRIFHPNVDEMSGSICLDSLNKTWSPAFTLLNIVEAQLPYLLQYPNPSDPFNREAAALLAVDPKRFREYVQAHCAKHAKKISS